MVDLQDVDISLGNVVNVLNDKTFIFLLLKFKSLKSDFFTIETLSSELNK